MFRIGILGSDNTHALHFARLCNLPDENGNYNYKDIRVTAIYGYDDDKAHTMEVAENGAIASQASNRFFPTVISPIITILQ